MTEYSDMTTPLLKQQIDQLADLLGDDGPVMNVDAAELYPSLKRLHGALAGWIDDLERKPIKVTHTVEEIPSRPIKVVERRDD